MRPHSLDVQMRLTTPLTLDGEAVRWRMAWRMLRPNAQTAGCVQTDVFGRDFP
jgi:hypothetical protein